VTDPSWAEKFAADLERLYERAGKPELARLRRQGERQRPPVVLNDATLSDWLTGKSIPSQAKEPAFRFLVELLEGWAGTHGEAQVRRRADEWVQRCRAARRSRRPARSDTGQDTDRPGRPITEYSALTLEVHPAVEIPGYAGAQPAMPRYVTRPLDALLGEVVAAAAAGGGTSRMVMLIGGSSTGKTRAGWEAVQALPGSWRLWHPYDPTRPTAAADALAKVGPHTVVWLNEAQHYLLPADPGLGERIAAGLRSLLNNPARGPVLIVGTIWREYWTTLTAPPGPGVAHPNPQARDLLTKICTAIEVPDAFTEAELQALAEVASTDRRLTHAADRAVAGRVTQQLAGVPELVRRYRTGTEIAQAAIRAAMDARRLGHPAAIPHAFLEQAVPGYLDVVAWSVAGANWPASLDSALAELGLPAHGILGPLNPVHPMPGRRAGSDQRCYRLADYLEQTGRTERHDIYPPDSFWHALAATVTDAAALRQFGQWAEDRGRLQHAVTVYTGCDDSGTLQELIWLQERAGDPARATATALRAADDGRYSGLRSLANLRLLAGDTVGAEILARQAADRGDRLARPRLAELLWRAGDSAGSLALALQAVDQASPAILQSTAWELKNSGQAGCLIFELIAADHGLAPRLSAPDEMRYLRDIITGTDAGRRWASGRSDPAVVRELGRLRRLAEEMTGTERPFRPVFRPADEEVVRDEARTLSEAGDVPGSAELYLMAFARRGAGPMRPASPLHILDNTSRRTLLYAYGLDPGPELSPLAVLPADPDALHRAGRSRVKAGDITGAQALYREAIDAGTPEALVLLAGLQAALGKIAAAERILRFGLTASGEPAEGLDFGPDAGDAATSDKAATGE
jgi:hypothetical protein